MTVLPVGLVVVGHGWHELVWRSMQLHFLTIKNAWGIANTAVVFYVLAIIINGLRAIAWYNDAKEGRR